jgi:hypothetical protein
MYGFFIPTFVALSIFLLIVLIITGLIAKKLYPLMYCVAVFSYINLVTYWIDSYELKRDMVVLILAVSTFLMILFGYLISKRSDFKNKKVMQKKKKIYFWGIVIPSIAIVLFAIIGMLDIGLSIEKTPVSYILNDDLFYDCSYDYAKPIEHPSSKSLEIMNITIKNDFIFPRRVSFSNYVICSEPQNYFGLDFYDNEGSYNIYGDMAEIDAFSSKTITLSITRACGNENSSVSKIYIIETDDAQRYRMDCRHLSQKQKDDAVVIEVRSSNNVSNS